MVIRRELPALLRDVGAESLLDAPCGDFNWMRYTELGSVKYIGADVVPSLITRNEERYGRDDRKFMVLDITKNRSSDSRCDPLPRLLRPPFIPAYLFCGSQF